VKTGVKRTPLVALTANDSEEDVLKSFEAGCDSHLTKPIKKSVLFEVINRYTTKHATGITDYYKASVDHVHKD